MLCNRLRSLLVLLFALGAMLFVMQAQTLTTGDIAGVVTDSSGGVVPNATVTVKNLDTGESRTAETGPTGEYRLFDDHSSCGTRIFRAGRTISLPSGSPRGTKLQPGDEIYFGQACVRFEVKQG